MLATDAGQPADTGTLAAYLRDLDERRRSPATIAAYTNDLRALDPSPVGLRRYLAGLAAFKPATQARKIAAARSFCAWLGDAAPAGWESILQPLRVGRSVPGDLDDEAVARLLAAIKRSTPIDLRDVAMLRLLAETGCKVSELVGLGVADVLPSRSVAVGAFGREVPISEWVALDLADYLANGRPLLPNRDAAALFVNRRGERLTRQGAYLILRARAKAVGLRGVTPSLLRHAAARRLVADASNLKDAQYILGHASVGTTLAYRAGRPARREVA